MIRRLLGQYAFLEAAVAARFLLSEEPWKTNSMTTKKIPFTAFLAAVFAVVYLPVERVSAQAQDGNRYSTPIQMVVNAGINGEQLLTSHFGFMAPVGVLAGEQIPITLIVSVAWKSFPVGLAPLDGGEIISQEELVVDENGTVSFAFVGGNRPGTYRVLVTIASEQYELQLYVPKPEDMDAGCD
jgi:hypothetical protein